MAQPEKILGFVTDLHKSMHENQLVLVYNGEVNQIITKAFTNFVEKDLESVNEVLSIKKKVYHVMVECLQNISKHADAIDEPMHVKGVFMVGKNESSYSITAGNPISSRKKESISDIIDEINTKSADELKELRKEKMKLELSDKNGAGLGLIDIARKTKNKIYSKFIPLGNDKTYFILNVNIERA